MSNLARAASHHRCRTHGQPVSHQRQAVLRRAKAKRSDFISLPECEVRRFEGIQHGCTGRNQQVECASRWCLRLIMYHVWGVRRYCTSLELWSCSSFGSIQVQSHGEGPCDHSIRRSMLCVRSIPEGVRRTSTGLYLSSISCFLHVSQDASQTVRIKIHVVRDPK
jgi:hypothetical protein